MELLTYQEFTKAIRHCMEETVPESFQGCRICMLETQRNNRSLDILTLEPKPGDHTCIYPAIDIMDLFQEYRSYTGCEDPLRDTAEKAWGVMESSCKKAPVVSDISWENARAHIIPCLVNREGNGELLSHVPHRDVLDMAVICRWMDIVENVPEDQSASTIVTDELLDVLEAPEEDRARLFHIAEENARRSFPAEIADLGEFLQRMGVPSILPERLEIYVVSNQSYQYGAASLLDRDILDQIYALYDGPFYILPSSVHEFLTVPQDSVGRKVPALARTVYEINRTQVDPEERLSDNIYCYDGRELAIVEGKSPAMDIQADDIDIGEER